MALHDNVMVCWSTSGSMIKGLVWVISCNRTFLGRQIWRSGFDRGLQIGALCVGGQEGVCGKLREQDSPLGHADPTEKGHFFSW